jgi:hypothetical protein
MTVESIDRNWKRLPELTRPQMEARWHVNRWTDNGAVSLQVELGAGHAVLLSCSYTRGLSVSFWRYSGEDDLDEDTSPTAFLAMLQGAMAAVAEEGFAPPPQGRDDTPESPRRSFSED